MEEEVLEAEKHVNSVIENVFEYVNYAMYAVLFATVIYLTYIKIKAYYKQKQQEEKDEHDAFKNKENP